MAYCHSCGVYVEEQEEVCPNCRTVLKQECSDLDAAVYKGGKVPLRKHPRRGLAIAALVLGICSCVFLNITCGVLAIVFGAMAKAAGKNGVSNAGFVCGIIGVSLAVLALCAYLFFWGV